jgi:DNA invertase Pin-like site-specific DNA recombinase
MPRGYFSYIRVSTVRQGQTGTSLVEQREAIHRYARRWSLDLVQEFEERETAAKSGRPVFLKMLTALKQRKAVGVIIHKIDRSARNLRDWAELGEIIDRGIEVHFANENLDLESRGGRLSADIQAVVAADFIRNLRQEVRKGFWGRLKQGLYPMPAPVGYVNNGPGVAKTPDPVQAPLVRKAFELYASGCFGINALVEEMFISGLRSKKGSKITRNGMSHLLHNHFYAGLIRIRRTNELFVGQHQAIVPKPLFDRVQASLKDKNVKGPLRHEFVFRRLMKCALCKSTLIGETQKGYVYYRCHTAQCRQKCIREDKVEAALRPVFEQLKFTEAENQYLKLEIERQYRRAANERETRLRSLTFELEQLRKRLSNLTDAYLDGVIDKDGLTEKRNASLLKQQALTDAIATIDRDAEASKKAIQEILELANDACLSYKLANTEEKRDLLKTVTSNFSVNGKTVITKLRIPFQVIVERERARHGRPYRIATRTLSRLLSQIFSYVTSRKTEEDKVKIHKPPPITAGRLKLAFRRANEAGPERLVA